MDTFCLYFQLSGWTDDLKIDLKIDAKIDLSGTGLKLDDEDF
jgi:hypothetical protein